MNRPGSDAGDRERDFYAGAPASDGSSRLVVGIATVAAFLCAWTLWSGGKGSMARTADAGPPAPSALNMQKQQENEDRTRALDSGIQREQLISEIRQLRVEVAGLKDIMRNGQLRAEVTNLSDLKLDSVKLEVDYAKLREAIRQP